MAHLLREILQLYITYKTLDVHKKSSQDQQSLSLVWQHYLFEESHSIVNLIIMTQS